MSTTFMNLTLPTVSVTLGPDWANEVNAALDTIDSHDHSSGKGKKVPTSGININADLDFNNYRAVSALSLKFQQSLSTLTGSDNAASLWTYGNNLYYTNGSGVAVQITSGSSVITPPATGVNIFEVVNIASDTVISPASTYVVLRVSTPVPRNITLPSAAAVSAGRIYCIKDITGTAVTNNITVNANGADLIDGSASKVINSNFGALFVVSDGSAAWSII